jgi:hypothetical protein
MTGGPHSLAVFPLSKNPEIKFKHRKYSWGGRKKTEKNAEGRKSNLKHFLSLTLLPILPRF